MPHVDEGTLHMMLDGALRAEEPGRAGDVERHLAGCPDCRARLERAAQLRARAGEILAAVELEAPAPDFDDVLARSAARGSAALESGGPASSAGRATTARRTRRLAWAASFILALGTGYLIGDRYGFSVDGPGRSAVTADEPATTAPSEPAFAPAAGDAPGSMEGQEAGTGSGAAAEQTGPAGDGAAESAGAAPIPSPPAPRRATDEVTTQAAGADAAASVRRRQAAPEAEVAATPESDAAETPESEASVPPVSADLAAAAEDSLSDAAAKALLERRALEAFPDAIAMEELRVTGVAAPAGAAADDAWTPVDRATAEEGLGGPLLALPDATVDAVALRQAAGVVEVRSEQTLPGEIVAVVIQVRPDPDAGGAAALGEPAAGEPAPAAPANRAVAPPAQAADEEAGTHRVVVQNGAFLLTVRAPLPEDALRRLAAAAGPAP